MLLFHISHGRQRRTFITQYSRDWQNIHATYPGDSGSQTSWKFIQSRCGFIRKLHFHKQIYEGNIWNQHRHPCDVSVRRTMKYRKRLPCICYLLVALNHNFIAMTYLSDQYCKNMLNTTVAHVLYVFVHSN